MNKKRTRYLDTRILIAAAVLLGLALVLMAMIVILAPVRYLAAIGLFCLFAVAVYFIYRFVYVPYRNTAKVMHLFAAGYTIQDAFDVKYPLSREYEAVMERVRGMFSAKELISASKRQAQYLALQNQINPHFLYNTLEGIRGEAIVAKMTNIAEMTEALATFFRYTISNVENMVTLEEELHNVENYFLIQQYRFGDRLKLHIDCAPEDLSEVYKCQLPKLTLQPIVENAIIHGVEQKIGQGLVRIHIEITAKRLLITISDNGVGMPPEQLDRLNRRLNALSFEQDADRGEERGGIAIINVNNRIKLLFGEEYGISIYSTPHIGTDVSITLPRDMQDVRPLSGAVVDGKRAAHEG